MKTLYVKDIQPLVMFSNEAFAVKDINAYTDKNGKPYYDLILGDKTGDIKAKIWSDTLSVVDIKAAKKGAIVNVWGRVEQYKTTLQITVSQLTEAPQTDLAEYIEASIYPVQQMWDELTQTVANIKDEGIKTLLNNVLADAELVNRLKVWPAAMSHHHAFRSGLLQHILEMINIVPGLAKYFGNLNFDIIYAGIILHDIGKVFEIRTEGLSVDYQRIGNLMGHITLGVEYVQKMAPASLAFPHLVHIKHIILSHHGELQYGSPVVPSTPEAIVVHFADRMSAETRKVTDLIIKEGIEGMTNYSHFAGTRFWDGKGALN